MKFQKTKNYKEVIIIPTWNKLELLKDCLNSLKNQSEKNFAVIVLENGSSDKTLEFLIEETEKKELDLWVLASKDNLGFAIANNVGINFALDFFDPQFVVLLNNDALPNPDFLEKLTEQSNYFLNNWQFEEKKFPFLSQKDWRIGSFAPLIKNYYKKKNTDSCGIRIYEDGSSINRGAGVSIEKFKEEEEVFGPTGAASMYLSKALKDVANKPRFHALFYPKNPDLSLLENTIFRVEIKPKNRSGDNFYNQSNNYFLIPLLEFFASRYFAYFEDVDLAVRLRLRFWGCVFLPKVIVSHKHSATAGSFSPFKSFHIHRNQYFNLIRDFPSYHLISGFFAAFKRYFFLLKSVKTRKGPAFQLSQKTTKLGLIKIVLRGWLEVLISLPQLFAERQMIQSGRLITAQDFHKLLKEKKFRANLNKMIFKTPNRKESEEDSSTSQNKIKRITFSKEQKKGDAKDKDQFPEWF